MSFKIILFDLISPIEFNKLLLATLFTKLILLESLFSLTSVFVISIAGLIFFSKCVKFPSSSPSHAPLTAPQEVCPRTTINLTPAYLQAYSILPKTSLLTTFPATLTLNRSPIP